MKKRRRTFYAVVLIFCMIASACRVKEKYFAAPVLDFFHLDLVVDSADFQEIRNNDFLKNEFGSMFVDTTQIQGKPSIELYLLGQETFLHINLNKGYWTNRTGSGAFVFQTRHPDKLDSIIMAWQQFYPDSLYRKTIKSTEYEVGEVAIYQKRDSLIPVQPSFFPVFLTFSKSSYNNWGFSDSAIAKGVTMREYMHSWDSTLTQKLFKRINAVYVQITEKELYNLETAMKTAGYEKKKNSFVHPFNSTIHYTITDQNKIPKYTKIEIDLSRPANEMSFRMGKQYTAYVKGTKMTIVATGN